MSKKIAVIILILLIIIGVASYKIIQSLYSDKLPSVSETLSEEQQQISSSEMPANFSSLSSSNNQPPTVEEINTIKTQKIMNAIINTSLGPITVELYSDKTPLTVANFVKLAQNGFYNGVKFHRVIKDFMIQGGDPLTKDDSSKSQWGTGGPGYQFNDEPFEGEYTRGILAMANAGPNTNGSQFFIMQKDYPLPHSYVIFGKVISGMEVVDKIANLQTNPANDCPLDPPTIENIIIKK